MVVVVVTMVVKSDESRCSGPEEALEWFEPKCARFGEVTKVLAVGAGARGGGGITPRRRRTIP